MEFSHVWTVLVSSVGLLGGILGISHSLLRKRLMDMETLLAQKIDRSDARLLVHDGLEPLKVEYRALSARLEDLKIIQKELDHKLDRILELISHAKKD